MTEIVERIRIEGDSKPFEKAAETSRKSLEKLFTFAKKEHKDVALLSESAARQLTGATDKQSGAMKELAGQMTGTFLSIGALMKGLSALSNQVQAGVKDAISYRETTLHLTTALELRGLQADAHLGKLEAEAAALQDLTGNSDEIIRGYQKQAISMGVAVDRTDELITASYGLANAMGVDVNTAFTQLLKSQSGVAEETLRLVPAVRELTKEQLQNGEAIDIVLEKYGEFAATKGPRKDIEMLTNAWADLREAVANASMETELFQEIAKKTTQGLRAAAGGVSRGGLGFLLGVLFDPEEAVRLDVELRDAQASLEESRRRMAQLAEAQAGIIDFGAKGESPAQREKFLLDVGPRKGPVADFGELGAEGFGTFGMGGISGAAVGNIEKMNELDRQITEGKQEIWANHYETMEAQRARDFERELAWNEKQAMETELHQERIMSTVATFTNMTVSAALGAMEAWAEGTKVSGWEVSVGILKGVGRTLLGRGAADAIEAVARGVRSYGIDQTATTLASVAATELAIGATLFGGGLVMQRATTHPGSGKGAGMQRMNESVGGMGGSVGGATGGGGVSVGGQRGRGGPEHITIIFQGPTTKDEVGVAIHDALSSARAKGLVD